MQQPLQVVGRSEWYYFQLCQSQNFDVEDAKRLIISEIRQCASIPTSSILASAESMIPIPVKAVPAMLKALGLTQASGSSAVVAVKTKPAIVNSKERKIVPYLKDLIVGTQQQVTTQPMMAATRMA
jgi:hypothetical protein